MVNKKLSSAQKKKVSEAIETRLGHSNFTVEYEENSSLLGGLQIYFGDSFLDCSLSTRINRIRDEVGRITL